MTKNIDKLSSGEFDVLVIGGGINGAAIANMASLNGLRTALIEKDDFSSGTSSKSTKLIHGGLRYLENFDFALVREALRERHFQLHNAPHLVKPLKFIIPVYKKDQRPFWMIKFGVFLYDLLSGKYVIEKHQKLEESEVKELIPDINTDGLLGGVTYFDAQMNDARIVLENVICAEHQGAIVANYTEVKTLIKENGKTVGVVAFNHIGQRQIEIRAKKIVVAAGPWTNEFARREITKAPDKIRATKGVHLVYEDHFCEHAVLIPFKKSKRIFFVIPWRGQSLIGTTDTDFTQKADTAKVEDEDIDYLLNEMKRVFPDKEISKDKIIISFAGLRPLIKKEGDPGKVSRKHVIEQSFSNLIYVYGGKYTTFRVIASDVLKRITKKELKNKGDVLPMAGDNNYNIDPNTYALLHGIELDTMSGILDKFGSRYEKVLKIVKEDPANKERLCSCSPAIKAEVIYSLRHELAQTVDDIYFRRLELQYFRCETYQCRENIKKIIDNKY